MTRADFLWLTIPPLPNLIWCQEGFSMLRKYCHSYHLILLSLISSKGAFNTFSPAKVLFARISTGNLQLIAILLSSNHSSTHLVTQAIRARKNLQNFRIFWGPPIWKDRMGTAPQDWETPVGDEKNRESKDRRGRLPFYHGYRRQAESRIEGRLPFYLVKKAALKGRLPIPILSCQKGGPQKILKFWRFFLALDSPCRDKKPYNMVQTRPNKCVSAPKMRFFKKLQEKLIFWENHSIIGNFEEIIESR